MSSASGACGIDLRRWPAVFVTGTDTGVGKTRVACALLQSARRQGLRAAGFKPVASGARETPQGLRNADAEALLEASAPGLEYASINPQVFAPAIAPHLAARDAGAEIDIARIDAAFAVLQAQHDCVIVEGAGGWQVPLDAQLNLSDWVAAHRLPVVLVVGMRLGCLNHALLSAESIVRRTALAGWVANCLPPVQDRWQDNVDTLRARMPAPLLAVVAADADATQAAHALLPPALMEINAANGVLAMRGPSADNAVG